MAIHNQLIAALWVVFVAYWAVAAGHAKRNVEGRGWPLQLGLRLGFLLLILLAFRLTRHAPLAAGIHAVNTNRLLGAAGVALCGLGIGLAIAARRHLGRNWGMPMSRKENPELVTSGPYAFIRHPIYTGVLLAMLGSAIGQSLFWLLPLVVWGAYFVYSARLEEKLMIEQFPQDYPAYMKRTKMLLPFVF